MTENAFGWLMIAMGLVVLLWVLGVEFNDYRKLHQRIHDCHQRSGEVFINEGGEYLCLDPTKIGQ